MPHANPINAPLLASSPTENRTTEDILRRGWRVDLCLSLLGVLATVVVVALVLTDHRNVVLAAFLAFTVPLTVFPWLEYLIPDKEEGEYEMPGTIRVAAALDVALSTTSLLFAISASWGVVLVDRARNPNTAGFQPTMWPVDAFHFVSASFVSSMVSRRAPNGWYDLLSVVLGVVTSTLMLLTIKSFTDEWYVGASWVDKVFQGTTEPFPNVTRITRAAEFGRDMSFYGRFGCAIGCASFEMLATTARAARFSITRCGMRDKRNQLKWTDLMPSIRLGLNETAARIVALCVVFFVCLQLALVLIPYPRWVVYDSRHVAVIAGLAFFSTPQGKMHKWEGLVGVTGLGLGAFMSTWATLRSFDLVLKTLASTQTLLDVDDPVHVGMWSYEGYEREFKRGSRSFLDVYQYAAFDHRTVPAWFAGASIATHLVDVVLCGAGSGAFVLNALKWYEAAFPSAAAESGVEVVKEKVEVEDDVEKAPKKAPRTAKNRRSSPQ